MSKFKLNNVQINFPSLYEHAIFPGNTTGKYECTVLIKKGSENEKIIRNELLNDPTKPSQIKTPLALLKDGDDHRDNKNDYEYYKGHFYFKLSNKNRPVTVDQGGNPIAAADGDHPSGRFYSGCVVNLIGSIWWQNNDFGKHARANLLGVQLVDANTEPFMGASEKVEVSDFDDLSGDSDQKLPDFMV